MSTLWSQIRKCAALAHPSKNIRLGRLSVGAQKAASNTSRLRRVHLLKVSIPVVLY